MVGFVLIAIMQNTPNMILTNGEVKMNCNRKDICYHYPKHCELCQATSDVVNTYPCFQDKDIVGVVRCKDCEYCEVLEMDYGGKQYWCKFWNTPKREYADAFCCHGKPKEKV